MHDRKLRLLACVSSVSSRVIARKLEREQKKNGRGRGEEETLARKPQAVCVTTHKGSWVKLLLRVISIVTRSSSHESNPGIKTLLPFLKNITEESDLENFQDLIVALDACY